MKILKCIKSRGYRAAVPALLAVVAAAQATPALTANNIGPDVVVRYADLDVDSAQGAALLLKRIESAAQRICAPLDHGDLASRASRRNCYHTVTAAAVANVNHPALAAVYQNERHTAPPLAALVR